MPKMGGCELRDEISKVRSNVRLLLMSGYPGDSIDQSEVALSGTAFIEKPFTPDELVSKVREVLGSRDGSETDPESVESHDTATRAAHGR
jgi:DNA-binding NtrC family response regulator